MRAPTRFTNYSTTPRRRSSPSSRALAHTCWFETTQLPRQDPRTLGAPGAGYRGLRTCRGTTRTRPGRGWATESRRRARPLDAAMARLQAAATQFAHRHDPAAINEVLSLFSEALRLSAQADPTGIRIACRTGIAGVAAESGRGPCGDDGRAARGQSGPGRSRATALPAGDRPVYGGPFLRPGRHRSRTSRRLASASDNDWPHTVTVTRRTQSEGVGKMRVRSDPLRTTGSKQVSMNQHRSADHSLTSNRRNVIRPFRETANPGETSLALVKDLKPAGPHSLRLAAVQDHLVTVL
ncbi:hypothetical protein H4W33_009856 [Kibdelosporangium phytohabitans]|nr:hypothetical protein [Kibdelosporangium phytohabitans]